MQRASQALVLKRVLPPDPLSENPIAPTLIEQDQGHKDESHNGHDGQSLGTGSGVIDGKAPS
jgi:hypothetical protein